MFGKRITLFTVLGFTVRIDLSWIVIAFLITWTLAEGTFRAEGKVYWPGTRWAMGVVGAAGLFASIIFHELWHSLVARRFGMEMKGITLFIFGGVAEMNEEPPSAKAEFFIAIAGPIASVVVGGFFYLLYLAGVGLNWPVAINDVLLWLAVINIVLVVFNLLPGFPLDGGRVLRSILWYWKKNVRWATRVASRVGGLFGLLLILLGVMEFVAGNTIGGIWSFLIGMFLRSAASQSYRQLVLRQSLEGEPVSRFMTANPVTVPPSITIEQLVTDYLYQHHHKMFPVVEDGRVVGCISTQQIKDIPRPEWPTRTVRDIARACTPENTIGPQDDAMKALDTMNSQRISRLLVVDNGQLVGIITLKDLLDFFSLKVELEGDGDRRGQMHLPTPSPHM